MDPYNAQQQPQSSFGVTPHPYDNSPGRQVNPISHHQFGSAQRGGGAPMPFNSQFIQPSGTSFQVAPGFQQQQQNNTTFQQQQHQSSVNNHSSMNFQSQQKTRQWQNYDIKPPVTENNNYDQILQEHNRMQDENFREHQERNNAIQSLEKTLDVERQKTHQMRIAMQQDNEREKQMNQDFENKIKSLREDAYRKDEAITEMQKQISHLKNENQNLEEHNKQQAQKLFQLSEQLNTSKRSREEETVHLNKQINLQEERYRSEIERMNIENQQSIESLNKQWDFKHKALEEKCRNLLQVKAGIESELRAMDQELVKERMEHEERLRQKIVQIQEEEQKKYQSSLRSIEQKQQSSEQSFQNMMQKNRDLIAELAEREKTLREQSLVLEQIQNQSHHETSELQNQINHLTIYREQMQKELNTQENQYRKTEAEYLELKRNVQGVRDESIADLNRIEEENRIEKTRLEAIRDKQARKITEQEKTMAQMDEEIEKLRHDQERLKNLLQDKIKNTIDHTVVDSSKYVNNPEFTGGRPQHALKY